MKILYGIENRYTDITCFFNNIIYIPLSDTERSKKYGGDPVIGVLKHIVIIDDDGVCVLIEHDRIYINFLENGLLYHKNTKNLKKDLNKLLDPDIKLAVIQQNLNIKHGNKYEEGVEQFMCAKYVKPYHRVLEFGGNIGRTSCVIGTILQDSRNLVVFESFSENAEKLRDNRDENKLFFHIEPKALSNHKLMQKDWNTFILKYPIPKGYFPIDNITFPDFKQKWGLNFDILVVDCEGAIYDIFKDMEEIIQNIEIVILENDFLHKEQGDFVHNFLQKHGFTVDFQKEGGWGYFKNNFYQAWVR